MNLLLDDTGVLNGYYNLDPFAGPDDAHGRTKCDLHDLSPLVAANEATELVAHDILDYLSEKNKLPVLDHWVSRLRHKGKIHLSTMNFKEIAKSHLSGRLDMSEVNRLLHQERSFARLSLSHVLDLAKYLEGKGLKTQKVSFANYRGFLTMERP